MPTYSRQITFNSFEQGGFYVSPYHQEYDSSTEIRSPIIDVDFYNSKISVNCGNFQWSFVCFDSSGNFINIDESLGYKNSGDEIDISAYTQAKKIRIELHSDNGIAPPQTCNLVYTVYYSWYINDYGELDNDKFLEITEPMSKSYPHALWRIDSSVDDGLPYNELLLDIQRVNINIYPQPVPPRIHVFNSQETDFSGNGLAIIDFISCHVRQEKNGMYELELTAPVDEKTVYLKKQAVLKIPVPYRDSYTMQLFRVYAVKKSDNDSETGRITLNLRHIFYDISRFTYGQISIGNKSGQDALNQMLGGGWFGIQTETMPFAATSNISTQLSEEYEYVTVTAALIGEENSFINRWGGELFRDNFRFSINSVMENSQTSGVIRYATNMTEIEFTEDDSELLTDLIAWDNFGQKKTISNPNIPTDEIPHRIYKCVHFNYAKLNTAQFESDAQKYFDTYSQTQVNIRAKLAQLPNTELYAGFRDLNNYEVGDRIIVYHSDLDIYYSNLEIISREFDVVIRGDNAVAENVDIEIGTFKNAISRSAYMSNTVYRESEKRIPEIISRLEALESTTTEEV